MNVLAYFVVINLAVTYFPGQLLVKYLRRRRA
jgi:hypothetical protein